MESVATINETKELLDKANSEQVKECSGFFVPIHTVVNKILAANNISEDEFYGYVAKYINGSSGMDRCAMKAFQDGYISCPELDGMGELVDKAVDLQMKSDSRLSL